MWNPWCEVERVSPMSIGAARRSRRAQNPHRLFPFSVTHPAYASRGFNARSFNMTIVDAISAAPSEHAVYFLVTAYIESLRHFERSARVPEPVLQLPISGRADLARRLDTLGNPYPTRPGSGVPRQKSPWCSPPRRPPPDGGPTYGTLAATRRVISDILAPDRSVSPMMAGRSSLCARSELRRIALFPNTWSPTRSRAARESRRDRDGYMKK